MHPELILTAPPPLLVVGGGVPCKDLVQVVIFERFPLEDEVGKTSTNLAEDSSPPSRVAYAPPILRGQVGFHGLDKTDRLGVRRYG